MKYYLILSLCLLISLTSAAQEISIVVYDGKVVLNNKTLLMKTKYEIPLHASITYDVNTQFTIFSKNKVYKKINNESATINYSQILQNLKVNAPTGFWKLMSTYQEFQKIESDSKGSSIGAVKGLNGRKGNALLANNEIVSPIDSAKTASKSITLNWDLKNGILGGRLYVVHQQTLDTIYNQPANNVGKVDIKLEKSGTYNWFIYSKAQKKKPVDQYFIKLTEGEANQLNTDLEDFKKGIVSLDEELKDILVKEYKLKFAVID